MKAVILETLASNNGIPEKEPSLLYAMRMRLTPPPTEADFKLTLRELEARGLVAGTTNALDGIRRWAITDAGKLALATL